MVVSDALVDPTRATTVRFTKGAAVPTDGPLAEIKESLAGYWLIEASHERAAEVTSRVVANTECPIEVRQLRHQPAES